MESALDTAPQRDGFDPQNVTRIFVRPVGTPLPLGFLALCGATTAVSAVQLGWVPVGDARTVGLVLLVFAAPLQFLAASFGFLARDPVAGTGMALLSGTWAAVGLSWHTSGAAALSPGLGVILVAAGGCLIVPSFASVPPKVIAALVMVGAASRFAVTGAYELGGGHGVELAAGWLGIALAGLAWYAALALEIESARKKTVLPTLRFGSGKRLLKGSLAEEIAGVHHEAGVRQQL